MSTNDQEMQVALIASGDHAVAVVGRGASEAFRFIRTDGDVAAAIAAALMEGFDTFAGVMATVDGQAVARCNPGLDNMRTMVAAAFQYARLVVDRLKQQQAGDEVEWLGALYRLPDTRSEL